MMTECRAPEYMDDRELREEHRAWLLVLQHVALQRLPDKAICRFGRLAEEFFLRQRKQSRPSFGTKEEIEEEQERLQSVVKRLPDPNQRRAQLRREELRCAFVELLSSEEGKRLIEEGLVEGLSFKRALKYDAV